MKKLFKIRNQNKSTEQGFSIAVSTGFGLIIMIIGLTMMGRAMKDSSVSASQKIITRSDAAAQVGSTRLLSLIAKYPQLASVEDCKGSRNSADNVCPDGANDISWKNYSTKIPNLNIKSTDLAAFNKIRAGEWIDIDSSNPDKGQFRILGYNPSTNSALPGLIDAEGRVGQRGTGATATSDVQTGASQASADVFYTAPQAEKISDGTSSTPFPGIWLTSAPTATPNQYYLANGLLEDSYTGTNKLYADLDSTKAKVTEATKTPLRIVDFRPDKPASFTTGTNGQTLSDKPTTGNGANAKITLPGASDTPTTKTINGVATDVYEYYATNISKNVEVNTINSSGAGTNKPKKVIIYLDGDLDLSGSQEITHSCKDRQGTAVAAGSCDLSNFQIYGYKTAAKPNPVICTHGNKVIEAFIIAPDHTAGMKGGGSNDGGVQGALWAKSWGDGGSGCNSNSNHAGVQQKGTAGDLGAYFKSGTPTKTITSTTSATVSRKIASTTPSPTPSGTPSPTPSTTPSPTPSTTPSPTPSTTPVAGTPGTCKVKSKCGKCLQTY
jgi:hypothetical protein